ncbi:hypothetical protein AC578_2221 [Pseudocercospora eumusae]|uniref:Uncharacterized protein n=1 Tax=Pseudocercospora eumusae TaxID=321146 RepID=A0A139HAX7_9PEZI|nr:hypothetical protein AC578_2221 [Pseudocercospora eumusae]
MAVQTSLLMPITSYHSRINGRHFRREMNGGHFRKEVRVTDIPAVILDTERRRLSTRKLDRRVVSVFKGEYQPKMILLAQMACFDQEHAEAELGSLTNAFS